MLSQLVPETLHTRRRPHLHLKQKNDISPFTRVIHDTLALFQVGDHFPPSESPNHPTPIKKLHTWHLPKRASKNEPKRAHQSQLCIIERGEEQRGVKGRVLLPQKGGTNNSFFWVVLGAWALVNAEIVAEVDGQKAEHYHPEFYLGGFLLRVLVAVFLAIIITFVVCCAIILLCAEYVTERKFSRARTDSESLLLWRKTSLRQSKN